MDQASASWARVMAIALLGGAVASCRPRGPAGASVDGGGVAEPSTSGSANGCATAPAPSAGHAPPAEAEVDPGCPPDVRRGTGLPTTGEESAVVKAIPLTASREPRTVVVPGQGATMIFGRDEFTVAAKCLGMKLVVDYLATRSAAEEVVPVSDAEVEAISSQAQFVVAALLDRGHARVREDASGRNVDSIVRVRWSWMGCGGNCRQNGREYRFQEPGGVFYRTTDLFADAFPRHPRMDASAR